MLELLECTKCGKCREGCPSYRIFMNESFSPRGRLMLIKTLADKEINRKSFKTRIFSCLLCGKCETTCPLQINLTQLVYQTRAKMKKDFDKYIFKYFSLYTSSVFALLRILNRFSFIADRIPHSYLREKAVSVLKRFSAFQQLPKLTEFPKIYSKIKAKARVALFLGCSSNYLIPSIGESLLEVLNLLNYEVIIPNQHCCGAPLLAAGFKKEAVALAIKNIKLYNSFNIKGVITPCPTCAHFLKDVYKELTGQGINILSLAELLESDKDALETTSSFGVKSIFHVSCHTENYTGDSEKILNLLKISMPEIEKKTGCCGSGGVFSFLFEKQSMEIVEKKVLEYEKADMIITSCPNCIIQFRIAMRGKKIMHYAELIRKNLKKGENNGKQRK